MSDQSKLSASYQIRSYEADSNGYVTLHSISNYLQETAGEHARQLNFDIGDLGKKNQTWVLQRLIINIKQYPKWRDTITVKTWPSDTDGLRAYRDFELLDDSGNLIGVALSFWLIIDLDTRSPIRVPQSLREHPAILKEHVMPVKRDRISFELTKGSISESYIIQPSDIDVNQHVNNAVYVRLIENTVKRNLLSDDGSLNLLDISFLNEAYEGEEVTVFANSFEDVTQLMVTKNDTKLVRASIELDN